MIAVDQSGPGASTFPKIAQDVEAPGGKTSHRQFHRGTAKITLPGHGGQDLSKKHTGMIVRQLERAGFPREVVRKEWAL